jgi:hypothetical protein
MAQDLRTWSGAYLLKPFADFGFQLRGALLHALIAHRLVFRGVGFDLGAIEVVQNTADMAEAEKQLGASPDNRKSPNRGE